MRAINFLTLFAVCLALVLFSIENTEPVVVKVVKGVDIQAPLCVELIVAMGLGATLAWVFSLWTRLQRLLESRPTIRQLRDKESHIQELEKDIAQYKAEIEEQRQFLPATKPITTTAETTEILAQR